MKQFWLLAVAVSLVASCKDSPDVVGAKPVPPEGAIAQVGDGWILSSDLEFQLERRPELSSERALEMLIEEEVLAQQSRASTGADRPELRAAVRSLFASRYLENGVRELSEPTEGQLRALWGESKDRFSTPAQSRIACVRQKLTPDTAARLETAREEFLALPEDSQRRGFGAVAAKFSDETNTRYAGGDCGWVRENQKHLVVPPEVIDEAIRSETGLVDRIIEVDENAWLVLVLDKKASGVTPFEMVVEQLRREWLGRRSKEAKAGLIAMAKEAVSVSKLPVDLPVREPRGAAPANPGDGLR